MSSAASRNSLASGAACGSLSAPARATAAAKSARSSMHRARRPLSEQPARHMKGPEITLAMMGQGPFGPLEMAGIFTVVKVRDDFAPED